MPKASTPKLADWRCVWQHVEARRNAEGLTWAQVHRDSGISERTFTQMRKHGKPLTLASKRAALAGYMKWTIPSLDVVAAGGEPEASEGSGTGTISDGGPRVSREGLFAVQLADVLERLVALELDVASLQDSRLARADDEPSELEGLDASAVDE